MSSDGSVMSSVSRIRQFGLYRSIDARTEEFLRASRKKQIRQGCACAAVSTAITVTVVVSVILVYEYSINGESNPNKKFTLKPNWIGFMNESTDVTQPESKFTKKMNFDKTTMKLLPILIKALNTNRYLEKILEDYSSTSPAYEKKDTTEFAFKKNVFDKKQWLKMPTSRLYTTDYKSSPSLLKMPANNLDYFRRRRKMKDYQRMLNYFDKMIGDKVGSSQQVIANVFEYTESPPLKHHNTPAMKSYKYQKLKHETTTVIVDKVIDVKKEDLSCKCPINLGQMLSKLINSLKGIIPNVASDKLSPCEDKITTTTTSPRVKSSQKSHTLTTSFFKTTTKSITPKTMQPITEDNVPKGTVGSTYSSTDTNIIFHKIYFPEDETSPLTPNFKGDYNQYYSFYGNKITMIPKKSDSSTTENVITEHDKILPTTTDNFLRKVKVTPVTYTSNSKVKSAKTPVKTPIPQDYEYDDYVSTTTNKYFNNTRNPNLELVIPKNKSFIEENEPEFGWNSFRKLGSVSKYFDLNPTLHKTVQGSTNTTEGFDNTRRIKHVTHSAHTKSNEIVSIPSKEMYSMESPYDEVSPYYNVLVLMKKPEFVNLKKSNKTATENWFRSLIKNYTPLRGGNPRTQDDVKVNKEINIGGFITDTDLDKVLPDDEFQEELSPGEIENIKQIPSDYNNTSQLLDLWDLLKYNSKSRQSMLPTIRPINLEVQRNGDWRHDDHYDYDSNYNNSPLDLPNI